MLYIEEESDMLVRDRGLLYYRLLKSDTSAAQRIVGGAQKVITLSLSSPKAVSWHGNRHNYHSYQCVYYRHRYSQSSTA